MAKTLEQRARMATERLLEAARWLVQDYKQAQIHVSRGETIRKLSLNPGFGVAGPLCYVNARAARVIETKKDGADLTSVEVQSGMYSDGLSKSLPG